MLCCSVSYWAKAFAIYTQCVFGVRFFFVILLLLFIYNTYDCDDTFHHGLVYERLLMLLLLLLLCSLVYSLARHFFSCASVAILYVSPLNECVSMIQCNIDNVYMMLGAWCVCVVTGLHHIWSICYLLLLLLLIRIHIIFRCFYFFYSVLLCSFSFVHT